MIKLQTSLIWPGCAMGKYIVKAKGFLLAILRWGDANGPLPDWSPIVPIDPAGNGECFPRQTSVIKTILKNNMDWAILFFSSEPLNRPKEFYTGVLDLADLKLFPNLCCLNIEGTESGGKQHR